MITRILLFIKHRLPFVWRIVDWLNAGLYNLLHRRRMAREAERAFAEFQLELFEFRPLRLSDLGSLAALLERQGEERLRYFHPHGFDQGSLERMLGNSAFLMFGVFSGQTLVGYFFLRCFWTKRCFVGRLIDEPFERQGIGRVMNQIMYHTAWWSGFRCMTTISRNNKAIMRSHERNPYAHIVSELSSDYLLVEFRQIPNDEQN